MVIVFSNSLKKSILLKCLNAKYCCRYVIVVTRVLI
jgi:hypothetical protein